MESWAVIKKALIVWRCHQLHSGFLPNGHLNKVSRQSHLSANDKGHNEMIPGFAQISWHTPYSWGKPQSGDCRWRMCDQASPQMGSLSKWYWDYTAWHGGRRKGWKEKKKERIHSSNSIDTADYWLIIPVVWGHPEIHSGIKLQIHLSLHLSQVWVTQ
jgi:hypothetical protein